MTDNDVQPIKVRMYHRHQKALKLPRINTNANSYHSYSQEHIYQIQQQTTTQSEQIEINRPFNPNEHNQSSTKQISDYELNNNNNNNYQSVQLITQSKMENGSQIFNRKQYRRKHERLKTENNFSYDKIEQTRENLKVISRIQEDCFQKDIQQRMEKQKKLRQHIYMRKQTVEKDLQYIKKKDYMKPELQNTIQKSIQNLEKQIEMKRKEHDQIQIQQRQKQNGGQTDKFRRKLNNKIDDQNWKMKQVIYNSGYASVASDSGFKDDKKTNQDGYFMINNFCGDKKINVYCVIDGHGDQGHLVTNYVKEQLQRQLKEQFMQSQTKQLSLDKNITDAINNGFRMTNEGLKDSDIDHSYSGCLVCLLVIAGDRIYSANLGEGRAIIYKNQNININGSQNMNINGSQNMNINGSQSIEIQNMINMPTYFRLTIDQNVKLKSEKTRLEMNDVRIVENQGNFAIYEQELDEPGYTFTRSLGASCYNPLGIIQEPVIRKYLIQANDEYVVLGTQGLWKTIGIEQVKEDYHQCFVQNRVDEHCHGLTSYVSQYQLKKQGYSDDVTAIVLYLKI